MSGINKYRVHVEFVALASYQVEVSGARLFCMQSVAEKKNKVQYNAEN
jgi:hypothetical protein